MLSEIETLLSLQEWVVERRLPYLPILAPCGFERGRLVDDTGKNMRADILLCSLLPDRNEIIPVQVKNNVTQWDRAEYHPGVVLVGPRQLGLESSENCIVRLGEHNRTGLRTVTKYGTITEHHFAARKILKNNAKVPKAILQAYTAALQPAFGYFDDVIPQQIRTYKGV